MQKLFVALFLLALVITSCNHGKRRTTIGYLQITEDEVIDLAQEGVWAALRDSGFIDGQNIRIINNNAQGDLSMIPTILQSFLSQGADLIITSGTPCMVAAAQMVSSVPVVFTVAFSPEQVGMEKTPSNLYGFYEPIDARNFVTMMTECLPSLRKVGLPYNNAEANAEYSAKIFTAAFKEKGIEVVTASVTSCNDLTMVSQYLVGQHVDAIIVAADNTVCMGLNVLAKTCNESRIPLFVTEPDQANKGAAVGFGVNYRQWGYQTGLKAIRVLKGQIMANKIEPITINELYINEEACLKQGVSIPENIREKYR